MTPATAQELVAAATLPEGWSLTVQETRRHKFRSKWSVTATYRGIARASWATYRVGAALPAIVEWIEKHPVEPDLVVVADADGWVKSMEDQA